MRSTSAGSSKKFSQIAGRGVGSADRSACAPSDRGRTSATPNSSVPGGAVNHSDVCSVVTIEGDLDVEVRRVGRAVGRDA